MVRSMATPFPLTFFNKSDSQNSGLALDPFIKGISKMADHISKNPTKKLMSGWINSIKPPFLMFKPSSC